MRRRQEPGLIDVLADILNMLPIWAGPLVAVVIFVLGWWVVPTVMPREAGGISVAPIFESLSRTLGTIISGLALVIWVGVTIKRLLVRRSFDSHQSLESVRTLPWNQFEQFVGEAFRREGYHVEHTGTASGDGGIDLVLRKNGETVLVQCKQWKAWKVGVKPVRELLGVITSHSASAGILATSGRFTAEAVRFAQDNRIRLIDGPALERLVASVRSATVSSPRPVPVPSSSAEQPARVPVCGKCGASLVVRTAKKGQHAGQQFWACPNFPSCRYTQPM